MDDLVRVEIGIEIIHSSIAQRLHISLSDRNDDFVVRKQNIFPPQTSCLDNVTLAPEFHSDSQSFCGIWSLTVVDSVSQSSTTDEETLLTALLVELAAEESCASLSSFDSLSGIFRGRIVVSSLGL